MVLTLGLVVIASVLLHEGGHALAAKRLGWRVVALRITRRGPALDIRTRDPQVLRTAWAVALAGPLASLVFAAELLFLGVANPMAYALGLFNLVFAVVNLVPMPGSDGRVIAAFVFGSRGRPDASRRAS
jgi:Zn-dependent protease